MTISKQQKTVFAAKKVRILHSYLSHFGLSIGDILDTIPCPDNIETDINMRQAVWVFSKERKEPFMLLSSEYEFIND